MMNCVPVVDNDDEACAHCKQGSDTVKLKSCTACRHVKYCGVGCQKAHRKQHKRACKQRAEELKDELLYSRGHERPEGDFCPICTLPIPLPINTYSVFEVCCMTRVCNGCAAAAHIRGMFDCAFCRTPLPDNDAEKFSLVQARVEKKDPAAINHLGDKYYFGALELGLQKDSQKAVELWTEAADLGSIEALDNLGNAYCDGNGVQEDEAKGIYFYEIAAMQGDVSSRHNIGVIEGQKGNHDRALRHFLISAKMGDKLSVEQIKKSYRFGFATKE